MTTCVWIRLVIAITSLSCTYRAESCEDMDDDHCRLSRIPAYLREDGQFRELCLLFDTDDIEDYYYVDCSSCLRLSAYCYDGFNITLTGEWIGELVLIWKCLSSSNLKTEGASSHYYPDDINVMISLNNYSNCTVGGCYQDIFGNTFLAKLTSCSIQDRALPTVLMEPTATSELNNTTSIKKLNESVSVNGGNNMKINETESTPAVSSDPTKINTISLIVVPSLMGLVIIILSFYILHRRCLRDKRNRKSVIPHDMDVFDVSFQPVTVDFRPDISQSKESVYFQLDHEYETLNEIASSKNLYSSPKTNICSSKLKADTTIDSDGYSTIEVVVARATENNSKAIKTCTGKLMLDNKHHKISQDTPIEIDDSSGFESAGFDYVDKNYYKFPPHTCMLQRGSDNDQSEQHSNVLDVIPDNMESPLNDKKHNNESGNITNLVAYENVMDSVENLSLTQEECQEDSIQHYPSKDDFDSQYIFALDSITLP